jgi:hypothetical protein
MMLISEGVLSRYASVAVAFDIKRMLHHFTSSLGRIHAIHIQRRSVRFIIYLMRGAPI